MIRKEWINGLCNYLIDLYESAEAEDEKLLVNILANEMKDSIELEEKD